MKYYSYTIIVAAFLIMYFSMIMTLKHSMEVMLDKRLKTQQVERFYEQTATDGL